MSEGMYGQSQVLVCGCVGACTCFSEPYQYGNHWYTQDANGYQYLWTGSGWVNASSAEAQSVLTTDTSGATQHYVDPASGAAYDPAYGTIYQYGGYWYTQGSDGYPYVWTTSGWLPAAPATGYVDPATAAPADTVVGPPAAEPSTGMDETIAVLLNSGDPAKIQLAQKYLETKQNAVEIWLNPGGEPTKDLSVDWDRDSIPDSRDYDPYDRDVQDPMDDINPDS